MSEYPLFEAYPALRDALPRVALAVLPTPVEKAQGLDAAVYVKRDDQTAPYYGGNKVRKLELLLGRAQADGVKSVVTFGAAGSNHALATAICARRLGMDCVSMLVPQVNARSVRRNLLMGMKAGAELHHYGGRSSVALGLIRVQIQRRWREGRALMIIPPGGSSALGAAAFVNAAFELKEQVDAGALPPPDCIYAASGTMGTVVGLLLGVCAAGLPSRIVAVRVTAPPYTSPEKARLLFEETNALLRGADPGFPRMAFPEDRFELRDDFLGPGYAVYTPASVEAVQRARACAGIRLEGTYTGKAFAALMADTVSGALEGRTALFWNTYNGRDLSSEVDGLDYHALPKGFHQYFEDPVQPLDG